MSEAKAEFRVVRRGYDKSAVDAHVADLRQSIDALQRERDRFEQQLGELDVAPASDLQAEIDAVQTEVGRILQTAREAAEAMRARAADDAARWRSEADTESRLQRTTAQTDAEQLRKDAWETGTSMLAATTEESGKLIDAARQDSLFIRAESEREALHLTSDARRESDELLRTGRAEAERIIADARAESQRILAEARQSAEAAHERARALEERRTKLLDEIESTRSTMSQLERELDARRESLQYAGVDDLPEITRSEPEKPAAPTEQWGEEGGAVRIVTTTAFTEPQGVDADELADEVRRLRETDDVAVVAAAAADEEGSEPEPDIEVPEPDAPATPEAEDASESVAPAADDEPDVDAGVDTPDEPDEPNVADEPDSSGLQDLFARLRDTPDEPQPDPVTPDREQPAEVEAAAEPAVAVAVADPVATEPGTVADLADDPFDVRDRLLLPIENRALRSVKRQLVDLQNRVLEDLRIAGVGSWEPEPAMFTASFSEEISGLVREAVVAGVAGAAELTGASTPQPPAPATSEAVSGFVGGLIRALGSAHSEAASPGAGARKVASAVSKVFRAWRTDEAERRLRSVARGAYHRGMLSGLGSLGVSKVLAIESGTPCDECPARDGLQWGVAGDPPAGTVLPPALSSCACTVVPAR